MQSSRNLIASRTYSKLNSFLEKMIMKETEVTTNHLTPELKLHLITENCRLFHSTSEQISTMPFTDPFWGFYWPGGQAVTRFILDNPSFVRNKSVLDFGSVCGASTIAAKICGSRRCVANDIDEVAAIAAQMNAKLNNVTIETDTKNLINHPDTLKFDLVLLGDVFYDEEFASLLIPWVNNLLKKGNTCVIGDPGRHALSSKLKLKQLASYELPPNVCIENHGFMFTNVFKVTSIYE